MREGPCQGPAVGAGRQQQSRGTHADGEHGPRPVHGIAVRAPADVSHVLPGPRQAQLPLHELRKRPHPVRAAADADELERKDRCVGTQLEQVQVSPNVAVVAAPDTSSQRKQRDVISSPSVKGHWNN